MAEKSEAKRQAASTETSLTRHKAVFTIRQTKGGAIWLRIGSAFTNKDVMWS